MLFLCSSFHSLLALLVAVRRMDALIFCCGSGADFHFIWYLTFVAESGSRDRHPSAPSPVIFWAQRKPSRPIFTPFVRHARRRGHHRSTDPQDPRNALVLLNHRKGFSGQNKPYKHVRRPTVSTCVAPTLHLSPPLYPPPPETLFHTTHPQNQYIPAATRNTLTTPLSGYGKECSGC